MESRKLCINLTITFWCGKREREREKKKERKERGTERERKAENAKT